MGRPHLKRRADGPPGTPVEKLAVVRQGVIFTLTEFDGSPVRRVTFEFREAGPKPIVRWVPRRK